MAIQNEAGVPVLAQEPKRRQIVPDTAAADGYIDFYGYAAAAGGWLFCGWSAERWVDGEDTVTAHFERGRVVARTAAWWHDRADLGDRGTGVVVFLRAAGPALGDLAAVEVRTGGGDRRLRLPSLSPAVR